MQQIPKLKYNKHRYKLTLGSNYKRSCNTLSCVVQILGI